MKRPATIFFKCPKCGSTEVQNNVHGDVRYHVCYGCGHKWSEVSENSKSLYRLMVSAVVAFWFVLLLIIIKSMLKWISM